MKSKTKINKQIQKKTNSFLVETIISAQKNKVWKKVAEILSGPRRNFLNINLQEINELSKDGETVVVSGKVLSQGNLDKKVKIVAFKFSEKAKDKLLKSKVAHSLISDEIKSNPQGKGVRILTK